jgi:hypothetical protein
MKEGMDRNNWKIISSPDQALLSRSIPTKMMSNPLLLQISHVRKESLARIARAPTEKPPVCFHHKTNEVSQRDPNHFFVKSDTLYEKPKCCIIF